MEEAKRVLINFVTWNSAAYLPGCFASLDEQEWKEFTVTVVDNASNDGAVKWLQDNRPDVTVLRNFRNQGAARAKNQAIALGFSRWQEDELASRFIMFASPEIELAPTCLARLVAAMDADPSLAACGPKVLRAQFRPGTEDDHRETERSTIIESTGLCLTKSRSAFERGAGEEDRDQYDNATDVFGFSGGCVLLRASALASLKLAGEWFDEDFFEDWDDVDLAWRLHRLGMKTRFIPDAVAWRHLSVAQAKRVARRAPRVKDASRALRNRVWTAWKNDEFVTRVLHAPWIIGSLFNPLMWIASGSAFHGWGKMASKRAELRKRAKASGAETHKWFV